MVMVSRFAPLLAAIVAAAATLQSVEALPHVDPSVHRTLRQQNAANIIVTMNDDTNTVLHHAHEASFADRGQRIASMVESLEDFTSESQRPVHQLLQQETSSSTYKSTKSFWITNQVFIEGASATLVEKLSVLPSIATIREEQVLPVPTPAYVASVENATIAEDANEWGVIKVKAPDAWTKGFNGQNVVVGAIDTGVLSSHEALKDSFRGAYGWFDPEKNAEMPYDGNGHGSHVIGSIAGSKGIGVAPGAKWMMCKACRTRGCPESDLLACGEFMTCPTDTKGQNKDCSKAPHIVSNSWGGGQGDDFYKKIVDAWQAAGIIPVFANGNEGPYCETASSPADLPNVISVGATDKNDVIAKFSSKGPSVGGLLKPEISAPGHMIRSSWNTGNSAYKTISGTSMATPHVSGCAAVILSANPGLKFDEMRKLLTTAVDTEGLTADGTNCGGKKDNEFPNNAFGNGRINVLKAVENAKPTPLTGCAKYADKEACETQDVFCHWDWAKNACAEGW